MQTATVSFSFPGRPVEGATWADFPVVNTQYNSDGCTLTIAGATGAFRVQAFVATDDWDLTRVSTVAGEEYRQRATVGGDATEEEWHRIIRRMLRNAEETERAWRWVDATDERLRALSAQLASFGNSARATAEAVARLDATCLDSVSIPPEVANAGSIPRASNREASEMPWISVDSENGEAPDSPFYDPSRSILHRTRGHLNGAHAARDCTGCRVEFDVTPANFRWQRATQRFHTRCRACERNAQNARNAARRDGTVPAASTRSTARSRRFNGNFGIELEVICSGGRVAINNQLAARGLVGWRTVYDGSLSGDGVELVSPVLQGAHGLDQVRRACEALQAAGCTVNRSCGMHVHLDLAGLPAVGVKRFILAYLDNHDIIDGLVTESRRGTRGYYCRPWNSGERARLVDATDLRAMSRSQGERYRSINLESYRSHGTVELRQHQGTMSFRKIESWVKFMMALLAKSLRTAVDRKASVKCLLDDSGADDDTVAYLLGRAFAIGYAPVVPALVPAAAQPTTDRDHDGSLIYGAQDFAGNPF